MSILFNKKSNPLTIKYKNTNLTKVIYGNTIVWQLGTPVSNISYGAGGFYTARNGLVVFATGSGSGNYWNVTKGSIPSGSCVSWYGSGAEVVANVACKVTFVVTLSASCVDGGTWYAFYCAICRNGAEYSCLINGGREGAAGDVIATNLTRSGSITLSKGQRAGIYVRGGNGNPNGSVQDRTSISGSVRISATPI